MSDHNHGASNTTSSVETDSDNVSRDLSRDIKILLSSFLIVIGAEWFQQSSGRSVLEAFLEIRTLPQTTLAGDPTTLMALEAITTQAFIVLCFIIGILFVLSTGLAILSVIVSFIPSDSEAIQEFVALRRTSLVIAFTQIVIYISIV